MVLNEREQQLVLENYNLIHHAMKRIYSPTKDRNYEDYEQEGAIGLIKAAKRFDVTKGFKFSTFAVPHIIGYIKRYIREFEMDVVHVPRKEYGPKELVEVYSLNKAVMTTDEKVEHIELVREKSDVLDLVIEKDLEERLSSKLTGYQVEVYKYMATSMTQMEIAKELGISQAHVSRVMRAIRKKLEEELYDVV